MNLLRNLEIKRPNQVWATDITYISTVNGHLYLVAVIDWFSRKILSWRLSTTLETQFCIDALDDAINKYGALDNIMIERFWGSLKREKIYCNELNSVAEVKTAIKEYICFYNGKRPHQSLNDYYPDEIYKEQKISELPPWESRMSKSA